MCARPLLLLRMEHLNDWDLQAVVRSCSGSGVSSSHPDDYRAPAPKSEAEAEADQVKERAACGPRDQVVAARGSARAAAKDASALYELEYLDLDHKPFLLSTTSSSSPQAWTNPDEGRREVMISFPAAAASTSTSTSGGQTRVPPGRKPGIRSTPRPKRSKKSQLKKVVCEVPVADGGVSSDLWAWRKYGQKPIKGSPYPRGYYKCSSMKGCMARKMVERSPAKPGVLVITYMAEHCHPVPTQINALAGTTRHKSNTPTEDHPTASPKSRDNNKAGGGNAHEAAKCKLEDDNSEASAMANDENEFWPMDMALDDLLAPMDGDLDHVFEEEGVLGRRLSL